MKTRKSVGMDGFSLVEVLIVLGVLSVFTGGVISAAAGIQQWQAKIRSGAIFNELELAVRMYRADHGQWPDFLMHGEVGLNEIGEDTLVELSPYLENLNPSSAVQDGFGNRDLFMIVDLEGDNWIESSEFRWLPESKRPEGIRQRVAVYSLHGNGQLAASNW